MTTVENTASVASLMSEMGARARASAHALGLAATDAKNRALVEAAQALRGAAKEIIAANERDLEAAQKAGASKANLDRLMLNDQRIEAMARGVEDIAALPDPVGRLLATFDRPNGLKIERIATRGVSDKEMARARALLRSGVLHELSTRNGIAHAMGQAEALLGDWREAGRALERYAAVTAADVRRAAREWLDPVKRNVVWLEPEGTE